MIVSNLPPPLFTSQKNEEIYREGLLFLNLFVSVNIVRKISITLHPFYLEISKKRHNFATMNVINRIWRLYYDGFRSMTLGRTLWAIILVKLFIIFVVLKLFFFPNYIKEHTDKGQEAEFVATQLKE